jgi:hypothetical protein
MGTEPPITCKPIAQLSYTFLGTNCVRKSGTACILLYLLWYYFLSVHTRFPLSTNIIFNFSTHFVTTALTVTSICFSEFVITMCSCSMLALAGRLHADYSSLILLWSHCISLLSGLWLHDCLEVYAYVQLVQHLFFPSSSILHFPFYLPCYYLWPCSVCPMLDLVGWSSCTLLWVCCISVVPVHGCRLSV